MGLTHYYTGKPCPRGHAAERYTSAGTCTLCAAHHTEIRNDIKHINSRRRITALRAAAKDAGLQYYYTGRPCRKGHTSARYVGSQDCVECAAMRNNRQRSTHPLRSTWYMMVQRCHNEDNSAYEDYGERGISVCARWLDTEYGYDAFVADMGPRPEGFSLDRIDNDGNYEPSNCRWADNVTQSRNRRSTKLKGEDVLEVFRLRDAGLSTLQIGSIFRCTRGNIAYVLKNRELYIEQGLGSSTQAAAG